MQNFSKLLILGLFCFAITSCERDKSEDSNPINLNEDASEIEILENTYKKTAFKETINVTSSDGLLKYVIQVGSFDEERFREGMKVKFKLMKNETVEVGGTASSKFPIADITNDLQRLIFDIRSINDRELSNSYTLALDFAELNLNANQSKNAKVNDYWNYELVSDLKPKNLQIGRNPFSTGSIYFWLEGKSCGLCGWNTWYSNSLPIPSAWTFDFDDYRRGLVKASLSPGSQSGTYFTFYY